MKAVIVQRTVPHYRVGLFEELWSRWGWVVLAGDAPPPNTGLSIIDQAPWRATTHVHYPIRSRPYLCVMPRLLSRLDNLKAEIVISEFSLQMSAPYQLLVARKSRRIRRLAWWWHGYNHLRDPKRPVSQALEFVRRPMARQADAQLVYSDEGALRIGAWSSQPTFVASNTLKLEWRGEEEGPGAGIHLLALGRLTEEKKLPLLIEAFAMVRQRRPHAQLHIVGDGPKSGDLRTALERWRDDGITLHGAIHDPEGLTAVAAQCNACIFGGTAGLGVNHALSFGLPVMALDSAGGHVGHPPEVANVIDGKTGHLIQVHSAEGIADAVLDFYQRAGGDPRRALRSGIKRHFESHLTLESQLEGFERMREYLMSSRDGGGMSWRGK